MDPSQPNVLQRAKQGDPAAIGILLNRSLQSRNINAKVVLRNSCLHIMLEANQTPEQEFMTEFIRKGLNSLGSPSIKQAKLYGKRVEQDLPEWNSLIEFEASGVITTPPKNLETPQHLSNLETPQHLSNLETPQHLSNLETPQHLSKINGSQKKSSLTTQQVFPILLDKVSFLYKEIVAFFHSSNNKHKKIVVLLLPSALILFILWIILSIANSIFSDNPQKVIEGYYKAIQEGDKYTAKKYFCIQSEPITYPIKSWKVLDQKEKPFTLETQNLIASFPTLESTINSLNELSGHKYFEVSTRVNGFGEDGSSTDEVYKGVVWRTQDIRRYVEKVKEINDAFEAHISGSNQLESANNFSDLEAAANKSIAISKFFVSTVGLSGKEENLTSEPYCIQKFSKE